MQAISLSTFRISMELQLLNIFCMRDWKNNWRKSKIHFSMGGPWTATRRTEDTREHSDSATLALLALTSAEADTSDAANEAEPDMTCGEKEKLVVPSISPPDKETASCWRPSLTEEKEKFCSGPNSNALVENEPNAIEIFSSGTRRNRDSSNEDAQGADCPTTHCAINNTNANILIKKERAAQFRIAAPCPDNCYQI